MSTTESEKNPHFASRLRTAREGKGLSQRQLALRVGSTAASVSRFEQGTRYPGVHLVEKLADELDVTVDFLLGYAGREETLPAEAMELASVAAKLSKDDIGVLLAMARALLAHRKETDAKAAKSNAAATKAKRQSKTPSKNSSKTKRKKGRSTQ